MVEAARGRIGCRRDHPVRPRRLPGALRERAEGLRSDQLDRPQVRPPDGPVRADDSCGSAASRAGLRHRCRRRPRARRRVDRHRYRRAPLVSGLLRRPAPPGPRPGEPVLDPLHHPQHGRGLGFDRARHEGALDERVHGLRRLEHGDRRRDGRDSRRARRRDDRGRDRGADHPRRDRRVRRDARALTPQRRPRAGIPALRPRPRRPRHGRGRRCRRARRALPRPGARREDLCRAARLRDVGRRCPHDRARPDRPEPGPLDAAGARKTPASTRPRSGT